MLGWVGSTGNMSASLFVQHVFNSCITGYSEGNKLLIDKSEKDSVCTDWLAFSALAQTEYYSVFIRDNAIQKVS